MPETRVRAVMASHGDSVGGGAERSLFELAVALERDGRVEPVVTVPREGALADALHAASVRTVVLDTPLWTPYEPTAFRSSVPLGGLVRRARLTHEILRRVNPWVRWLRDERPDVVLTSTATIPAPALASAVTGIPHVWWLQEFVTKDHGLRYALGERLSQRVIGRSSEVVVANSRAVRDHYSPPIRGRKMRVIPCGISNFEATPNRIEPPTLRALLLGRQMPGKGARIALEAVSILGRRSVPVELRLVGPIRLAYRMELNRIASELGISDRVEIVGAATAPQDQFAWANVVLMCSENEAYGRVTVEALKSGRPVVGTRSGGTPELITDGVNGFLFEPSSAHGLAMALARLAEDPALLARMSTNASADARDRFTLEGEVDAFVDAMTSVMGGSKRRRSPTRR